MPRDYKNIKDKGFDKNPQNINKNGRPKTATFRDLLKDIESEDFSVTLLIKDCVIDQAKGTVTVKIPSNKVLAMNLQKMAAKDVRWFQELCKVMGHYAPTKVTNTDPEGNAIPMTKEDIEMMRIFNEHHNNIQKSE